MLMMPKLVLLDYCDGRDGCDQAVATSRVELRQVSGTELLKQRVELTRPICFGLDHSYSGDGVSHLLIADYDGGN